MRLSARPLLWSTLLSLGMPCLAGENAAPSSHLVFDDRFPGDIVINEVRVPAEGEALYTYYETLGWGGKAGGYAGIQAHPRGRNYIFSIWDHKEHAAPIKAVYRGAGTITQTFGGEGTGLKSWNFDLGWRPDTWYTLVARCWARGDHTFHGFWVRSGASGVWSHLVTMEVAAKGAWFEGGTDAFIEDWLETGENARTTHLRGGWKRKLDGSWFAFGEGRYSVNKWDLEEGKRSFNYRNSWNGGVARDEQGAYYFMTAGGAAARPSVANPSVHAIERRETEPGYPALKISEATVRWLDDSRLEVAWELDERGAPQFSCDVRMQRQEGQEVSLAKVTVAEPHARSTVLTLPKRREEGETIKVWIKGRDILDREGKEFVIETSAEQKSSLR